jgi:AcrR family transcriptional regulator
MDIRDRILAAATRVYAETGFRGATTRRIAAEAGVNEITLFRHFGSKAALIGEAVVAERGGVVVPALPETPADPEAEVLAWARAHLDLLRSKRSLIRTCMGDFEEHPEMMPPCGSPTARAADALAIYVERLRQAGRAEGQADARVAAALLIGALFADAMGRDIMPDLYRAEPEAALTEYVRLFLRGIGVATA